MLKVKTSLSNIRDRVTQNLHRMRSRFNRNRASKGLSILFVALVTLLLLDVAFVLVQTALPADADITQSAQSRVTVTILATKGSKLAARPTGTFTPIPTKTAQRQVTGNATASPKVVTTVAPRIVETPLSEDEIEKLAAEPTPVLCESPVGRLLTDTVQSKVLGRSLQVHVYLPPCYNAAKHVYPTLYLIQGSAFRFGEWVEDGVPRIADLHMSLGILPPFIIVMPASDLEGGNYSKYTYSVKGKGSWEDFMVNELVPAIESRYSAWKDRAGRAIGGISRGGYWSLQIGFANPDKFSAVGGHSPSITSAQLIGVPANFSMLSLAKSIEALKTQRIYLDAGDRDWAQVGARRLAADLDAKGITYTLSIGEGAHLDSYWASRVPDYLAFYSATWPRIARAKPATTVAPSDTPDTMGKQP
jgi:enterochelin esterase-like enzyme